jgi:hypothetical protein
MECGRSEGRQRFELTSPAYYKQAKRIYIIPRSSKLAEGGHTPEEASASETFVQFATLI